MTEPTPAIEIRGVDVGCHTCLALNEAMKARALDVAMYVGILIGVHATRPGAFVPLCAECRMRWDLFKPALASLLMSKQEVLAPSAGERAAVALVLSAGGLMAERLDELVAENAALRQKLAEAVDHLDEVLGTDSDMPSFDATYDAAEVFVEAYRAEHGGRP